MKYIKIFIKVILGIIGTIILILLLDFIRINIHYQLNKKDYKETIDVQGNKNKYTPQGLTYSDKYNVVIQTSYNSKHEVSKIYVTDFKTNKLIKELKLIDKDDNENIHHVGGITTDNETVFITSDYEIEEYSLDEILNTNNDYIKSISTTKLPIRGDFCTYKDNYLWIGDFYLDPFYPVPDNNPLLLKYNIDNINYNEPELIISLPKMVQGLVITDDNKFIVTRSFTYLINSDLSIYSNVYDNEDKYLFNNKEVPYYKLDKSNKEKSIKLPPMAEELFEKDNKLYILFESSSDTYSKAYPKINKIIEFKTK